MMQQRRKLSESTVMRTALSFQSCIAQTSGADIDGLHKVIAAQGCTGTFT